jgi:hypothetical protein
VRLQAAIQVQAQLITTFKNKYEAATGNFLRASLGEVSGPTATKKTAALGKFDAQVPKELSARLHVSTHMQNFNSNDCCVLLQCV